MELNIIQITRKQVDFLASITILTYIIPFFPHKQLWHQIRNFILKTDFKKPKETTNLFKTNFIDPTNMFILRVTILIQTGILQMKKHLIEPSHVFLGVMSILNWLIIIQILLQKSFVFISRDLWFLFFVSAGTMIISCFSQFPYININKPFTSRNFKNFYIFPIWKRCLLFKV